MKQLAIFRGAFILAITLFKSLVYRSTLIYRCPTCNLCLKRFDKICLRCDTELDWEMIDEEETG